MANDVVIRLAGQEADLIRAFQRTESEMDKILKRLGGLEGQSKRSGKEVKGIFDSGVKGALAFGATLTGVNSITSLLLSGLQQVRKEFETIKEFQRQAGDVNVQLAAAKERAALNAGDVGPDVLARLNREIAATSKRTGVNQATLFDVLGSALSASGGDIEASLDATNAASQLAPNNPAMLATLAMAGLALRKISEANAQTNLGFTLGVGEQSYVVDPKQLAQNVVPAIIGITKFGDSLQEAGALVATLTQATQDPTGAATRTTSASLALQLREFLPEEEDTTTRILKLQGDEELRQRFLDKATFEKQAVPAIESLLTPEGFGATLRQTAAKLPGIEQGEEIFNRRVAALEADPSIQLARAARGSKAIGEELLGGNIGAASGGVAREALGSLLGAAGEADLVKKLSGFEFERASRLGQTEPFEAAAGVIEQRRQNLLNPMEFPGFMAFAGGLPAVERAPTQEELRSAQILGEAIKLLNDVAAKLDTITAQKVEVDVNVKDDRVEADVRQTAPPVEPPEKSRSR